jgi:lipopolysaccharide transport system ATP-binding protein
MYVRLAFAVAAHLESEILIVDEVLAVGDAEFQSKCLGKMGELTNSEGRTVLFVSHNMGAVKNLCHNSILMERGTVKNSGQTSQIIEEYLQGDSDVNRYHTWDTNERPGDQNVKLESIRIVDNKGSIENFLTSENEIRVEIEYEILLEVKDLRVVANVMSYDGTEVFSTSDFGYQHESRIRKPGKYCSYFTIPGNILNISRYHISVDIDIPMIKSIVLSETVSFSINELISNEMGLTIARKPSGVIHPVYRWSIVKK